MTDACQRHLPGLNATLQTPDEIILAALAEVSSAAIESRRRIAEGAADAKARLDRDVAPRPRRAVRSQGIVVRKRP